MSNFTTLNLTNDRVLIRGTDSTGATGEMVADGSQWAQIKRHAGFRTAESEFESEVEAFFAPLTEAADKLSEALATPELDPSTYFVFDEGTEPVEGKQREVAKLTPDSVILRLIEDGHSDRLIWVGDRLEVLEQAPAKPKATRKKAGGRS